jgi:hypothetical protein
LLNADDTIRFLPNPGFAVKVTIKLRAWDGSTGTAGATANLSGTGKTGAATAFSANLLTVTAFVNAAPTLGAATGPALSTLEDKGSAAVTIAGLLTSAQAADADPGALKGVAIVGATGPGTWQYSLNGTSFLTLGSISESLARLLPNTAKVRFMPAANQTGQATLTYRAWDRTAGASGSLFAVASTGGVSAFSAVEAISTLTITPINDAPVVNIAVKPLLTPMLPGTTNPPGDLVSDLLLGNVPVRTLAKGWLLVGQVIDAMTDHKRAEVIDRRHCFRRQAFGQDFGASGSIA